MTLVSKACAEGNLRQADVGLQQRCDCVFDAQLPDMLADGLSMAAAILPGKVRGVHSGLSRDLIQRPGATKVAAHTR